MRRRYSPVDAAGPKGTLKMLVGGAGQIKLTKDGAVCVVLVMSLGLGVLVISPSACVRSLLHECQIQHPTAIMLARAATAIDDDSGDGTTSTVLLTGEFLKICERLSADGVHPRILAEGLEVAKTECLKFLDTFCVAKAGIADDRELLASVARTCLRTKLSTEVADHLTDIITEAVLTVRREGEPIDLHMVERMNMMHQTEQCVWGRAAIGC